MRHTMGAKQLAVLALSGLLLAGCLAPGGPPGSTPGSPTPPATAALPAEPAEEPTMTPGEPAATPTDEEAVSPLPTPSAAPQDAGAELLASVAARDLARRLGPDDPVVVVSVERMEMPAGSLGCGEAGPAAGGGLIIGYEIRLSAGEQEYAYRSDSRRLLPCTPLEFPGGRSPIFVTGVVPTSVARPEEGAVAELARRLGIPSADITVRSVEAVDWPDASLGCPQPGMAYAQVITPGHRIVLAAQGRTYTYHTGEGRVMLCAEQ